MMKANLRKLLAGGLKNSPTAREIAPAPHVASDEEIDFSLLDDSLAKTPWERLQANDDALRFAEALRAAMDKRNAKP